MEIDASIRNATLGELQQLFGNVPAMQGDKPKFRPSLEANPGIIINIAKAMKTETDRISGDAKDLREENLGRSTIPGDELKPSGTPKKEVGNRYHQKWDIPFDSVEEPAKYEAARKLCKKFGKPYKEALNLADAAGIVKKERKTAPTKWQIPFSSKTQPHEYYLAWCLCREHNLPYPEALKAEEAAKTGVIPLPAAKNVAERSKAAPPAKKSGKVMPCPYCKVEMDTRVMHVHARRKHPGEYDISGVTAYIQGKNKIESLAPAPLQSDCNKITISTGMYVKQIKPYKGNLILGTPLVLSRNGNLVVVRNGNKKKHTIDVECLELAKDGLNLADHIKVKVEQHKAEKSGRMFLTFVDPT